MKALAEIAEETTTTTYDSSASLEPVAERQKPAQRRLNFLLSESSYQTLQSLASQSERTMTDLIRYSLGLMRIFLDARSSGHRVVIVDKNDRAIKEIVMPL